MTEEAQRIAIAEVCGWKLYEIEEETLHFPGGMLLAKVKRWFNGEINPRLAVGGWKEPPDYLHDLNAMHEAEASLSSLHRSEFARWLTEITSRFAPFTWRGFDFCHATASQRAEAFLRTIGKWVD